MSPTAPPVSPTPSKTGPLVTIPGNNASSPALYTIDNTTAILTDPYITTQGVTGYGKIYRGSAAGDDAPSSFLLGASTPSAFDTTVGFDTHFDTGTQIGAFLFNSLAFAGAPASISAAGGPTSLALVATNGITAAPASAATIDVSGLTQVLLATQNGPITLSNVTFTDNPAGTPAGTSLTLYARGAANSLSVTANLGVSGNVSLFGEGGLNFNQGAQALSASSATLISGADLSLGGAIRASGSATSALSATAAGNLTIASSGVLNTTGPLTLSSGGNFQSSGVANGSTVTINGVTLSLGGTVTASASTANAFSATATGSLAIPTGGTLTSAGALFLSDGGTFQSDGVTNAGSAALNITSAAALTTTANAQLTGGAITLTSTTGALTLGGTTLFSNSLTAAAAGDLKVPGVIGGIIAGGTTPQALGTAMFSTSGGNLNVSGQITAGAVTLSGVNLNLGGAVTALSGNPNASVSADASGNLSVATGGNLNTSGTLTLMSGGTFQSAGTTAAGVGVSITSAGDLLTTAAAQLNGPALTLASGGLLSLNGVTSFFNSVQASSVGDLNLPGIVEGATMDSPSPQTVGTATFATSQGNLTLSGQITAGTVNLTAAVGNYTSTTAATITANKVAISGVTLSLGGAVTANGTGANPLSAMASGSLTLPTGSTLTSAGALSLSDGGTFQSDGATSASSALNITSAGGLNTTANALLSGNLVTLSGADLSLGGMITASGSATSALNATATGNLAIPTGGVLNTTGLLTLMSGGTFQSDGVTSAGSNALNITSTSDLTTTANAQLTGGTVTLTSNNGALALGGFTLFSNGLTALAAGDLNISGVVGGIKVGGTTPQTLGTAMFTTSAGDLGVSGQITAGTVNLNAAGGNYASTSAAAITADAVTISGFSVTLGGAIKANTGPAQTINATAHASLTIPTGATLYATGPLTLTSGGTFQSDGVTRSAPDMVQITSLGDLTTTGNAVVYGKSLSLNSTNGGLTLGGTASFDTSLNASSAGAMNINGAVGGDYGSGAVFGTAMFGTDTGSISVGGQITASTVTFTTTNGGYSTGPAAAITANTVNISAPNGNVSLSSAAYVRGTADTETLNVTGNTITIPDTDFIPQANQFYELTQNGPFAVPASSAYAFDNLTLNNDAGSGPTGDLNLGTGSTLSLNTATVDGSLNLADGATFTHFAYVTIGQVVTLTGAPTLNINGTLRVNNAAGAADAFTATGAATINLGSAGAMGRTPTLYLPTGNFNGGAATINGYTGSHVEVDNGDFSTTGAVTADSFIVGGNVAIGGALQAGYVNAAPFAGNTITVGALSAGTLTTTASVFVNGDVTPYNLTTGDNLAAPFLGVTGALNYAGATDAGRLTITLLSGFNLGAGAASAGTGDSYAAGMDFAGAALVPTADNLTAGQGGSLTINTGNMTGTGNLTAGDFTGSGNSTYLVFNGGNLVSNAGNTGFGGNGGNFIVNNANNITLNPSVFVSGYGGEFINDAAVTGAGTPAGGNGGTFSLTAAGTITINNPAEFDLYGGGVGDGGASGTAGNGGTFSLNAAAGITINSDTGEQSASIDVRGGGAEAAGTGGNGGTISLLASGGPITVAAGARLSADGGMVAGASGTAGNGGTITLQAAGDVALGNTSFLMSEGRTFPVSAFRVEATAALNSPLFLTADGGTAEQAGLVGGNGGAVTISSSSTDGSQPVIAIGTALISATTGGNSMTAFGGTGGTINITASGIPAASPDGTPAYQYQIALDNTAVVASDDNTVTANTPNSHSQVGGTINLTSASTTGYGILIQDGSSLVALVNPGSTGAGGKINLLTSGGEIDVYGSSLAASGTGSLVQLSTQLPTSDGSSTNINLSGSTVSADTVKLLTAGPNDMVNLNGGNTVTAVSALTITANSINTEGIFTTDQLAASMTTGTINLNATNGTAGSIFLSGGSLSANTISLQAVGDDAQISIGNTPTITAGSNLTINGANIDVYSSGENSANSQISAGGTISLTASATTSPATIQISSVPLTADKFIFTVSGPSSFIDLDDEPSGNLVAQSSAFLSAPTISLNSSALSANPTVGTLTLDTVNPAQTGMILLNQATLSAAGVSLTARGTGGSVTTNDSTLNGAGQLAIAGTTIQVTGSTLLSNDAGGSIALGGAGGPGSGANIQVSGSTLSANGLGGTLTLAGAAGGTGADIQVVGTSTLSADGAGNVLTLTTASTTGPGILVSSSMLSSTNDQNVNFDGGRINLLTSGATIEVDTSTLTASGTGSLVQLSTQLPTSESGTSINLNGATLSADTVSLSTAGPNDQINISGGSTLTADSTLTINGHGITLGDYGQTLNQFLASMTGGTINLTGTSGSFNFIALNGVALSANTINIQTTGDSSSMYVDGGSTLTAGSTLTINSANIELGDGGQTTNQLLANNIGGTISLTAATTAIQGFISLNNCTVQADNITFMVSGPGSEILIENDQSTASTPATFAARSLLSLYGPTISIYNATLTADPGLGSMVFDTLDATQTGSITLDGATLSTAYLTLTARGLGGTVNITDSSSITGNQFLAIVGANIQVNNGSTLTSDPTAGSITLDTVDTTQTGMITLDSGVEVSANQIVLYARGTGGTVSLASGATLTSDSGTVSLLGANVQVTDSSVTANGPVGPNGGSLTIDTTDPTQQGLITLSGATLAGTGIVLNAEGTGGTVSLMGGSHVTSNSGTVSLFGANVQTANSTVTANGPVGPNGGSLTIDTADPTQPGMITLGNATTLAGTGIVLNAEGTGGTVSLTNSAINGGAVLINAAQSGGATGGTVSLTNTSGITGSAVTINAANIQLLTTSTLTANSGSILLDTADSTQTGMITVNEGTMSSSGTIELDARGTGGTVSIANNSSLTATSQLELAGANINVDSSTLKASASSGSVFLDTSDPAQNGAVTISSSTLSGGGTVSVLAQGTSGLITVGGASSSNMAALSADMLKMRAIGTNGSIVINANSSLSATTQLLLYADGSNGSITFQGGNITLSTGSMAGILAAPSITIKTGTTVTVTGSVPIEVFTNHANYSDDYGGNDTQSGGFAGTAQPSSSPQPFSAAPPYPSNGNALKVASNAVTLPAAGPTPAANATRNGRGRLAGTSTRPTAMPMQRPSIPFSALNLKDLSYDPSLLQGGPKTAAAAVKPNKAGTRAPVRDVSAGREKVRDAAARPEPASSKPAPALLASPLRPPH